MKWLILSSIRFYQNYLSVLLGPNVCRYEAWGEKRCSEYTYQSIYKYGILKGMVLGVRRILSCHPWHKIET